MTSRWRYAVVALVAVGSLTCDGENGVGPGTEPKAMKAVSGNGQTAPAGATLPLPLTILVTDAEGRPVPNVMVNWAVQGGGSISAPSVATNSDGEASVERKLGPGTGAQSTIALVTGLSGSPVTFTAVANTSGSESMAISQQMPTAILDDEVFAPAEQPSILILDAGGQPEVGREVTATIASGAGALRGTATATTDNQGIASFGDLGIDGTGAHKLRFTSSDLTVESPTITVASLPAEATSGRWGSVVTWPIVPLHIHMMPNGKVLAWGREDQPWVWTPPANGDPSATGTFVEVPVPEMLFCAGHALLPNGTVLVSGGHVEDDRGLDATYIFTANGNSGSWSSANNARMAHGRWYPTVTVLPNGEALTMAGRDVLSTVVATSEIWNGSGWRPVRGADKKFPYYPRNFVASNGKIYYAGEQTRTWWLTLNTATSAGSWVEGPPHKWNFNRDYGSAVMYDDDKVLYVGGGGDPGSNWSQAYTSPKTSVPTNTAEIINLGASNPQWQFTGSMQFGRRHLNATVLPNGEVLVTGGVSSGGALNNLASPTRAAELWNPQSGDWRTLASASVPRGYHAVSILLPNGLVLHGASGDANRPDGTLYPRQNSHEMFSPPYLFKGNRPTITSTESSVNYGETFDVVTPYARQITKVTWVRLASVTHAFDANQRLNTLSFTRTATGLRVTVPASATHAPPGHYALYVVNRNGVPSVGQVIKIQ